MIIMTKIIEMDKIEGKDVSGTEGMFTAYCFKHNGKYCYEFTDSKAPDFAKYIAMTQSTSCSAPAKGPDTTPMPNAPSSCNSQCSSDMAAIKNTWGCCFTTLLDACNTPFKNW